MSVNPCAEAARLREIRVDIISGRGESQIRFDLEEVRFFKADLSALDREIARLDAACELSLGQEPKRRRFAKRAVFRPY